MSLEERLLASGFVQSKNKADQFYYGYRKKNTINLRITDTIPDFNILERSILRDARIELPIPPVLVPLEDLEFLVVVRLKGRIIRATTKNNFHPENYQFQTHAVQRLLELVTSMKELLNEKYAKDNLRFKSRLDDYQERLMQFEEQVTLLRSYVKDYLSTTPQLEAIQELRFQHKLVSINQVPVTLSPPDFKPIYEPNTHTFFIFEGHLTGYYHINTNIKIHDSGWLLFYVNTFHRHSGHKSSVYYFYPPEGRFFNRNYKKARVLGNINKWEISWFNRFGFTRRQTKTLSSYHFCYICDVKLHYPAYPVKICNQWIFLLKACCACFKKMSEDPEFERAAILKLQEGYSKINLEVIEDGKSDTQCY